MPDISDSHYDSKPTRLYDIMAIAGCGVTLILALVLGSFRAVGDFGVETDFYRDYAVQAENILAGRAYTYQHHPPGYSILLAGVSLLSGDLFVAGKIISAFATALFGLTMYGLLKALFDPRIALVSTILSLLALIPHSFFAATDMVGALLMVLPLRILLTPPVLSLPLCLLTGVWAGAAYLVRSNGVSVILGIGFSLLFINLDHEDPRRRLVKFAFFACGALLTVAPWLVVNWKTNGSPFASTAYLQIAAHFYYLTGDQQETNLQQAALRFSSLWDVVLHDPARLLWRFVKAIFYENMIRFTIQGLTFPAYLFAGSGLLFLLREPSRKRLTFLVTCLAGYLLLGLVDFNLRFYLFLFPLFFGSVAYFFFHQSVFLALGRIPVMGVAVGWLSVIVLAAFLSINSYSVVKLTLAYEPRYLLEIASFLRNRSTPGERIIVRKSNLAYLAGLKRVFPLASSSEDYLRAAREIGARYIVYSDYEASLWPGLRSLRSPDAIPDGFKLIYRHDPTRTFVYEIYP